MTAVLADFHLLRPQFLWLMLPLAALVFAAAKAMRKGASLEWDGVVDAHLLSHLMVHRAAKRPTDLWIMALAGAWFFAALALSGPSWQKLPVTGYRGTSPVVVVLSLAQSMNGADLVPSRLTRASQKLRDVLDQTKGDDIALIIYSDQPFVAAPLTADGAVIGQMLPELSTSLMPVLGNRLDLAIGAAGDLLQESGAQSGRVLVMADDAGDDPAATMAAAKSVQSKGYTVSVLGVGTPSGAVVQTADGREISDAQGKTMTAKLDTAALRKLAEAGAGHFTTLTADVSDLAQVLPPVRLEAGTKQADGMIGDQWLDSGYWLVLIPLALGLAVFRRGVLLAFAVVGLTTLGAAPKAQAGAWADLWQTPDQQGQAAFQAKDFATAATEFDNPNWRAAALYKAGKYDEVADGFGSNIAQMAYNSGNALAKSGKLAEALAAYDTSLKADPTDADAKFNRDLVAKLLKQQQQKQAQKPQPDQKRADKGQSAKPDQSAAGQKPQDKAQDKSKGATKDSQKPAAATEASQQNADKPEADAKLPLSQADQQELRAVPDDPTGLLRARIAQHYADLQAGQ